MPLTLREHVTAVAAALALVSIGVVVAAVRGAVPAAWLPVLPGLAAMAPHANAVISVLAVIAIAQGWRWIRRGDTRRHRVAMIAATLLFVTFLALYLYKLVIAGTTPFTGPDALYATVYLPVLVIHMALAIVCIPLVYFTLLVGVTHPTAEIPRTAHPRVGRIAAPLWITSFTLGVVVYAMLYVLW